MTTVLEQILNHNQDWRITENEQVNKAVEAYKQLNAAFDNFIGTLTDCFLIEEQDAQAQDVFDRWYCLDDETEKKLVYLIAQHCTRKSK